MAISPLSQGILLLTTFLAVLVQSVTGWGRDWLGTQLDLLPALVVFAGVSGGVFALAGVSVLGGLWFDSLSANPFGISVLPIFIVGFLVHMNRELVLREQGVAQFVLGAIAGLLVPGLTLLMLYSVGENPVIGWGSIWQFLVLGVVSGLATPVIFLGFNWIEKSFNYTPLPESTFRNDREMKRGRD